MGDPITARTTSPAGRLLDLLERALRAPEQQRQLFDFWGCVLGIVPAGMPLIPPKAVESLHAFAWLVEEFERMAASRYDPFELSDYRDALEKARHALAWEHVGTPFSSVGPGNLTSEVLRTLRMCSRIAPETERLLTVEELSEISAAIDLVDAAIGGLPDDDALRRILAKQSSEMRMALVHYRISGVSALRSAVYALEGATINYADSHAVAPDSAHATAVESVSSLSRAVKAAIATTALVTALAAGSDGAAKLGAHAGDVQFFLQNPSAQPSP